MVAQSPINSGKERGARECATSRIDGLIAQSPSHKGRRNVSRECVTKGKVAHRSLAEL